MPAALSKIVRLFWIPCVSLLLAWVITLSPVYERLESWALDVQQGISAETRFFQDVLVVEIDESSIKELQPFFGAWPYKRDAYALILDYLGEAGARNIVIDVLFSEAREGDSEFQRAIATNGNIILAASALNKPSGDETVRQLSILGLKTQHPLPALHWPSAALPIPALATTSSGTTRVGMISVVSDEDGVLRNLPLVHEINGNYLPSLALASLFPAGKLPDIRFRPEKGTLQAGKHEWPVDKNGTVKIQYPGNANPVLVMPLHRLAMAALGIPSHELDTHLFKGKTIFIGNTALFSDRVTTPRGIMNGIHVIAITHEALVQNLILKPQHWRWNGLLLLCALLPALTAPFLQKRSVLISTAMMLGTVSLIYALNLGVLQVFNQPGVLIFPLMVASFSGVLNIAAAMREEMKQHAQAAISRAAAETDLAIKQQQSVAMVSHELRPPLAIIDASLQSLERLSKDMPPEILTRHQKINRASHRLQSLISNHLTKDRLNQADLPPKMLPVNLHELITTVITRVEWGGMTIHTEALQDAIVEGDAELLRIAFSNLIDNAIKYSPEKNRIWIEGEIRNDMIEIRISDAGIGIAPEELPRIFDQYYRAKGSDKIRGSGLGLYLVRQIIELHGGTLFATSILGQGTTMHVRIPARVGPGTIR